MCKCNSGENFNSQVGLYNSEGYSYAEGNEMDALLKEANEAGFSTVSEYMEHLKKQDDPKSKKKLDKLKNWIEEGKLESTSETTISIFNTITSLFGSGSDTTSEEEEEEEEKLPAYVWGIIGFVLVLLILFVVIKLSQKK